jgi:hypothetical protein
MRYIISLTITIIIAGCFSKKPEKTTHQNQPLPNFDLFLADGNYFNTGSIPSGKSVILFYFGPGCPYSHVQMDKLLKNKQKFKDTEFILFTTAPIGEMTWFYKKFKLNNYSNFKVGVDYKNFFREYFGTDGVPYLAVYGRDRLLNDAFRGETPINQLRMETEE